MRCTVNNKLNQIEFALHNSPYLQDSCDSVLISGLAIAELDSSANTSYLGSDAYLPLYFYIGAANVISLYDEHFRVSIKCSNDRVHLTSQATVH